MAKRIRIGPHWVTVLHERGIRSDLISADGSAYSRYKLGSAEEADSFARLFTQRIRADVGKWIGRAQHSWAIVTPPSGTLRHRVNAIYPVACRIGTALDLPVSVLDNIGELPGHYGMMSASERKRFPFRLALDIRPVPQNVLFVDDVVVSGATVCAAVTSLQDCGVRNVRSYAAYTLESQHAESEALLDRLAVRVGGTNTVVELLQDTRSSLTSRLIATILELHPGDLTDVLRKLDIGTLQRLFTIALEMKCLRAGPHRQAFLDAINSTKETEPAQTPSQVTL
jgi:phosphoribosylpyrophosphate synthetase